MLMTEAQTKQYQDEYKKERERLNIKYNRFKKPDDLDLLVELYFFMIIDSDEFEFHQKNIQYGYYNHPGAEGYLKAIESYLFDINSNKYTRQCIFGTISMNKDNNIRNELHLWSIRWCRENIEGYNF